MPELKLGKKEAVFDPRTLRAKSILQDRPLPEVYDVDDSHPGVPTPMYQNDQHGCCVIAARAHHTLRLVLEHGAMPQITDAEVLATYYRETGGGDDGLVMLDSLKAWRRGGWIAGRAVDTIAAFTSIYAWDHQEIKLAIYNLGGVHLGIEMPRAASRQFDAGQPWTVESGIDGRRGTWGGHAIYVLAWDRDGLTCVTWGKRQRLSWEWLDAYCSEAYGIVDSATADRPGVATGSVRDFLAGVSRPNPGGATA
jgi:hypothetical protein